MANNVLKIEMIIKDNHYFFLCKLLLKILLFLNSDSIKDDSRNNKFHLEILNINYFIQQSLQIIMLYKLYNI